jgi:hypothetical protein
MGKRVHVLIVPLPRSTIPAATLVPPMSTPRTLPSELDGPEGGELLASVFEGISLLNPAFIVPLICRQFLVRLRGL